MKFSIKVKAIVSCFIHSSGYLNREIGRYAKENFVILMYHRVLPEAEIREWLQAGMYVGLELFKRHIVFLKKNFSIIPFVELFTCLKNEFVSRNRKPICVLTFDDGWYDFYKYVYPTLKNLDVPATVFLPTDFIGTDDSFWTDRLSNLLYKINSAAKPADQIAISKDKIIKKMGELSGPLESKIEQAIAEFKKYRLDDIERKLSNLASTWNCNRSINGRAFLNWDEAREMTRSGLITFGSHTARHQILTILTDREITEELEKSKEKLIEEAVVDTSFIPFCYPNGSYNTKITQMVKNSGYHIAVTTKNGWNNMASNAFNLKRVGIHQDISSTEAMFGCRILNLF